MRRLARLRELTRLRRVMLPRTLLARLSGLPCLLLARLSGLPHLTRLVRATSLTRRFLRLKRRASAALMRVLLAALALPRVTIMPVG
jgi:hypothetical protein